MESVRQSPTDPDFVQSPYGFYRRLRAGGDFAFWEDYGLPVATTFEAVSAVLKHRRLGRAVPEERRQPVAPGMEAFHAVEAHSMLETEPPEHTRLRRLVLKAFTTNRIQMMAPGISQTADRLIDAFPAGPFDLLDAYARLLPVIVIARLLGVPEDKAPDLLAWSNAMVAMYQARRDAAIEAAAAKAAAAFSGYMREYVESRRGRPSDDLLSDLIAAEEAGDRLTTDEMIGTCILLLNAGHEATVHTIGNAVRLLVDHRDRGDALAPEHIAGTVEECLRFDPPLHLFTRHVYEPVTIMDQSFAPGDEIGCLLASANRDDAVWPDGEKFDPFRAPRQNVAFGAGIHFCVGAPLARLELQIALPVLFARCPKLQLTEEPWVANLYHFRGLERLTVTC